MPASARPANAGVLGLGELFGDAVIALGKAGLLEPGERPAGVGVEVAFLLGQRLVERLVDERQRGAYRQRLAFGIEHLGIAGIDRHAGANGGLRQVHWRDVAGLQVCQCLRQFGLERGDELAAGGGGGVAARWRQTRTMLEARALCLSYHSIAEFRPHRPSAADGKSCLDDGGQEGVPAGIRGALVAVAF